MGSLEVIIAWDNPLASLPEGLCEAVGLMALDLSKTQMAVLPKNIGKLTSLMLINVTEAKVSDAEIKRIKEALPKVDVQK